MTARPTRPLEELIADAFQVAVEMHQTCAICVDDIAANGHSRQPHCFEAVDGAAILIQELRGVGLEILAVPPEGARAEDFLRSRVDPSKCHADVRAYTYAEVLEVMEAFARQTAPEGAQGWRAYVQHKPDCESRLSTNELRGFCTCGLDTLLADPPAREETRDED